MRDVGDAALMQRAVAGLAAACRDVIAHSGRSVYGSRVLILAGAGNNGGDALYAGAQLARSGAAVTAILLGGEATHAAARQALLTAGGRVTGDPGPVDLVLDGIVGIGGHGGLRPAASAAISALRGDPVIVAVDVPSGVDASTGAVSGDAVHADLTVTFGCLKPGLLLGAGAGHAGEVRLVDIGLTGFLPEPRCRALDPPQAAEWLPVPRPTDDKYSRGVVGVVAGSPAYGGAAVLSVGGALRTGAGMVRYPGRAADAVRARWPEVVVRPGRPRDAGRVQAWVVGPGMGTDDTAAEQLADVLAGDVPVLVDADGITLLAQDPELAEALRSRSAPAVLTPHDLEFLRLTDASSDDLAADRLGVARAVAAELSATVLLKGNATLVVSPDGSAYVNRTGTPWLGTAGSGDVLSGCVGALLAAGLPVARAAALGAYLHGVAGRLASGDGAHPIIAGDVLDALPAAFRRVRQAG